jgi:hypothetical protein
MGNSIDIVIMHDLQYGKLSRIPCAPTYCTLAYILYCSTSNASSTNETSSDRLVPSQELLGDNNHLHYKQVHEVMCLNSLPFATDAQYITLVLDIRTRQDVRIYQ